MKWQDFIKRRALKVEEFLQNNNLDSLESFEQWRVQKGIMELTDEEKSKLFPKSQQLESSVSKSDKMSDEERLLKADLKWKKEFPKRVEEAKRLLDQFEDDDTPTTEAEELSVDESSASELPKKRGRKKKDVGESEGSEQG